MSQPSPDRAESKALPPNNAHALATALRRAAQRLRENPRILFEKEPDWEGGLNAAEINRLAERTIIEDRRPNNGDRLERRLIFHPLGKEDDPAEWLVNSASGDERLAGGASDAKLERTISHLERWAELSAAIAVSSKRDGCIGQVTALSRLDLPHIVEAIRELHRTIAEPPALPWTAPNWLVQRESQTTAGAEHLKNITDPGHAWLIDCAADEVLHRLTPPWKHRCDDCPEITDSLLEQRHKVELIELRKRLLSLFLGNQLAGNGSERLVWLSYLDAVLAELLDSRELPSEQKQGTAPHAGSSEAWAKEYPLVGWREPRRSALPELSNDLERQARYCMGFGSDWWLPALECSNWRTPCYPIEATPEAVQQWRSIIEKLQLANLGGIENPQGAADLRAAIESDIQLIREHRPDLFPANVGRPAVLNPAQPMSELARLDALERATVQWLAERFDADGAGFVVWDNDVVAFFAERGADTRRLPVLELFRSMKLVEPTEYPPCPEIVHKAYNSGSAIDSRSPAGVALAQWWQQRRTGWKIDGRIVLFVREMNGDASAAPQRSAVRIPSAVREWLRQEYMSVPVPDLTEPEPTVIVRFEAFTEFLRRIGVPLLPSLDEWKDAGWIDDLMLEVVPPDSAKKTGNASKTFMRLNLAPGSYRLTGIRKAALDAPIVPSATMNAVAPAATTPTPTLGGASGAPDEETNRAAETEQYVTLDQAAALVNRSKKTLARCKARNSKPLPHPDVEGGGGKADEWKWSTLRPWLEAEYGRPLPVRLPSLRR